MKGHRAREPAVALTRGTSCVRAVRRTTRSCPGGGQGSGEHPANLPPLDQADLTTACSRVTCGSTLPGVHICDCDFSGSRSGFCSFQPWPARTVIAWGYSPAAPMEASRLWGNHTTGEYTLFDIKRDNWRRTSMIMGDFAVHSGSHDGAEAGPRPASEALVSDGRPATPQIGSLAGMPFSEAASAAPVETVTLAWGGLFEILPERNSEGWHPGFRFQYDFPGSRGREHSIGSRPASSSALRKTK